MTSTRTDRRTIGALSKQTACNIETIRYYERIALLPPPPRTEGGHRLYSESHLRRLTFIRLARELGFTLDEVRSLLSLVDDGSYTCGDVLALTTEHLKEVRTKIRNLKKLEKTLVEIAANCTGDDAPECPIIEALFVKPSY